MEKVVRTICQGCHSEGRQISSLRKRVPDPEVEMHPDTAGKANLQEGDWVWIETPQVRGERVRFKVKFAPNIDPRVVNAAHGCFDSNIDLVMTDDSPREKICGSVPTRGTLCKVYK